MSIFRNVLVSAVFLVYGLLLTSGCFSYPRVETVLHAGQDGTVFLKEFPDSSVRASHPMTIDPRLVRKILLGIRVHERKTMIESTLTGEAEATPALTISEADFLTPLLVLAFDRATAEEAVHFRVNGDVSGKRFDTGGIIYVAGENMNLSLNEYGLTPQQPGTLSQPTKSFDRPKRWSVTFTPISAVLNAEEDKQVQGEGNGGQYLLISLNLLKRHLESLPEGEPLLDSRTEGHSDNSQPPTSKGPTKGGQSAEEMEEELYQLRKSLKDQEERLQRLERQMGE